MRLWISGASGYVGRHAIAHFAAAGHAVVPLVRDPARLGALPPGVEAPRLTGDLGALAGPLPAAGAADGVLHLAGLAHADDDSAANLPAFRHANVAAGVALLKAAAQAGARSFVYVSSVKVLGESSGAEPFRNSSVPRPQGSYALSKREAELRLAEAGAALGVAVTVLRPPLVLGPGARGNLPRLVRLVDSGLYLPLGALDNRRSYIGIANLLRALECAVREPPASRTLLVADPLPLSTPDLIRAIAAARGRRARLWAVPPALLRAASRLAGQGELYAKLCGSLEIECRDSWAALGASELLPTAASLRQAFG
jgi:nucleoside-diphosphate-sugar epimerase